MRLSTLRITLLTLTLGLVTLWVINQKEQATSSPTADTSEPYQWSSIQSITWEISRDQPEKQHIIQTATWHYNETSKLSQFTQPIITLTTPDTITVIRSQKGQTLNDEAIQLSGDVLITQNPLSNSTKQSTLTTKSLTYNANQAELLSRDTITLTQADSVTTGVGLHANLESGQFQLMSNVQSTYQPNKTKQSSAP